MRRQGRGRWLAAKRTLVSRVLPVATRWARYPYYLCPPVERATAPVLGPGLIVPRGTPRAVLKGDKPAERAPFLRLAVVHGLSSAGDAVVAIALAGSIFFDVSVRAAQSRVALSLALTVAPFAIVGPLLGPLVERARGGKRAMVIFSAVGRAICCLFMAFWAHSLLLFPVAFFTLVFSKLYLVTRAALVPGAVDRPEQLVLANSKLSVGGSAAGMVAGGGARDPVDRRMRGQLRLSRGRRALTRAAAAVPSAPLGRAAGPTVVTIPAPRAEPQPVGLPPGGLQLAAVATAGLRAVTGFVTFLLVFTFRRDEAALVWYGLALGASQVGNVAGALLAPKLRRYAAEEWMLTSSSVVVGVVGVSAGLISWGRHWAVAVLIAAGIGLAAGSGKLAFDSMVQRDVPPLARGRAFARFESGFQLSWAMGGLLAVLVPMALSTGFVTIGGIGLLGALAFARGSVSARRGTLPAWWPGSAPRPPTTQPAEKRG